MTDFERELCALLNRYGKDTETDTPDFILADYLWSCLNHFGIAMMRRDMWYSMSALMKELHPADAPPHKIPPRGPDSSDVIKAQKED